MKGKPQFSTQGQKTGSKHGGNPAGGGAQGQPTGKKNRPCKPRFGTQGQPKAVG